MGIFGGKPAHDSCPQMHNSMTAKTTAVQDDASVQRAQFAHLRILEELDRRQQLLKWRIGGIKYILHISGSRFLLAYNLSNKNKEKYKQYTNIKI